MANTHDTLTSLFTDIADAIRGKTKGTAKIVADNFPAEIAAIPEGLKMAKGTYTTKTTSSDYGITISGIGFTPKYFFLTARHYNYEISEYRSIYIDTVNNIYRASKGMITQDLTKSYVTISNGSVKFANMSFYWEGSPFNWIAFG